MVDVIDIFKAVKNITSNLQKKKNLEKVLKEFMFKYSCSLVGFKFIKT